jgi:hypothetical protein
MDAPQGQVKFDPSWFYKRTLKSSDETELTPELVMPGADEIWTAPNDQRMKWRDGWRSCWHTILVEFAPHAEARSIVRYSKPHPRGFISPNQMTTYQPKTGKEWLGVVEHSITKYQFVNEVFGWALNSTLKYCRYRMGWGQWSRKKRGEYADVPDAFFLSRPRSQRA